MRRSAPPRRYYEFFSGGGMARAGLGSSWTCLFANDIDEKKAASYRQNWGGKEILAKTFGNISTNQLPDSPELVWASFPCQDLSLAGMGAGLKGSRSGTFWPFWSLIGNLRSENRGPKVVVLENVCGALTSHDGSDFRSLIRALRLAGYNAGALVVDAARFLPQSRPRLFIIGVENCVHVDPSLASPQPEQPFHSPAVITAYKGLSSADQEAWMWWNLPTPPRREETFADLIEFGLPWHTETETKVLLALMSPTNLAKVEAAKKFGRPLIGAVYKRTRLDQEGRKAQRAEVRFDNIAGCLRTPGGGSSRQVILVVNGDDVKSRLLSSREAARLMGLPDSYHLPENYNDAYHLMGDGVAVPVVRHLAHYLLEPLLDQTKPKQKRRSKLLPTTSRSWEIRLGHRLRVQTERCTAVDNIDWRLRPL